MYPTLHVRLSHPISTQQKGILEHTSLTWQYFRYFISSFFLSKPSVFNLSIFSLCNIRLTQRKIRKPFIFLLNIHTEPQAINPFHAFSKIELSYWLILNYMLIPYDKITWRELIWDPQNMASDYLVIHLLNKYFWVLIIFVICYRKTLVYFCIPSAYHIPITLSFLYNKWFDENRKVFIRSHN